MKDEQVQSMVVQELKWEPSVRHADIKVSVDEGVVTLTGSVPCYIEKREAEKAAGRVPGVKSVHEKIKVKLLDEYKREDRSIAWAAARALEWDCEVLPGGVLVEVKDGWIKLTGEVEWDYQRDAAIAAVQRLYGVQGISCQILVRAKVHAADIKYKIEGALKEPGVAEVISDIQVSMYN